MTRIADKELVCLYLLDPETYDPLFVVGNYAAHPFVGVWHGTCYRDFREKYNE